MNKHNRKSPSKARQNTQPIHFEQRGKNLTSKAGLIPVIKFLEQLKFSDRFHQTVQHDRSSNAIYRLDEGVLLILTGLIGGAMSLSKCMVLWSGCSVLQKVAGWVRLPNETTLARLFKEVSERQISELETFVHVLRQTVWEQTAQNGTSSIGRLKTLWIDVDSSVKTVYGRQEGAAKGYNSHKKGALSYHPLLAFCTSTKEILQGWLRTGSAYTSNGIVEFSKQLLAQLPAQAQIVFRGDSGFFVGGLLDWLDFHGHGYLIKVKLKNLKPLLDGKDWSPIPGQPGWEQCRFWHHARNWKASRLLVAVRQQQPAAQTQQRELFERISYDYFCYTTTEALSPWEAHTTYGQRATSETWIEEAKSQLGLAHLKTNCFLANAALFQCAILAYNTLRWMALSSGNEQLKQWEPETIRVHCICVAGKLLIGGRQLRLNLPVNHLHPKVWKDWLALA